MEERDDAGGAADRQDLGHCGTAAAAATHRHSKPTASPYDYLMTAWQTERAARRIQELMRDKGDYVGVKIGVKRRE